MIQEIKNLKIVRKFCFWSNKNVRNKGIVTRIIVFTESAIPRKIADLMILSLNKKFIEMNKKAIGITSNCPCINEI